MLSDTTRNLVFTNANRFDGTRAAQDIRKALSNCHPVLTILDACLRAATDYETRFESKIADDYVLGQHWLDAASGARKMLDGDFGPIDNGTAEELFWIALEAAGYHEGPTGDFVSRNA